MNTNNTDTDTDTDKDTDTEKDTEKDTDTDINENKGKDKPSPAYEKQRFIKPDIKQIAAYCRERQNGIDAQRFFDYYESNGWKVGKSPMKDWKATVRNWERNGYSSDTQQKKSDNGFDIDAYKAFINDF